MGVPGDETIQADVTLNSISIDRAGGTILIHAPMRGWALPV